MSGEDWAQFMDDQEASNVHGSLNVPIEHHPTIRYMVYNGYYKVMSNIPKMGHLTTPDVESGLIKPPNESYPFSPEILGQYQSQLGAVFPP